MVKAISCCCAAAYLLPLLPVLPSNTVLVLLQQQWLLLPPIHVQCIVFINQVLPHVFDMPSGRSLYPDLHEVHSSALLRVPGTLWRRQSVQCRCMLVQFNGFLA
jgi:hypothetical protein